jgi:hypothetical protein
MKHPLNGVAIAAVIAITAPAWAQTPAIAPSLPAAAPGAPLPPPPAPHAKRPAAKGIGSSRDRVADQLNRAELARSLASGASAAPMVPVAGYPPPYPPPWGYPPPYPRAWWGYRPLYPTPWWGYPRPY